MRGTVLHVFCNEAGDYGNPVAIFDEGAEQSVDSAERQRLATAAGFSEVVFFADTPQRDMRIHTAQQEIDFAGHAAVGAAWYLANVRHEPVGTLQARGGPIEVSYEEDGSTWVECPLNVTPPWWHERLPDADTLESLTGPQGDKQSYVQLWSWLSEPDGLVRARTFAPAWGIPEDEANGSGCMRLAAALGRKLTVHHGVGSVIKARLVGPGVAAVGGRVVQREVRVFG